MADPETLEEALQLIGDIEVDRNIVVLQRDDALGKTDPGSRRRNELTFAHGDVRRMGLEFYELMIWIKANVVPAELAPMVGRITASINAWELSSSTKFDGEAHPLPNPPP